METTRAQGRPPRGDNEVGRTRLLDRTREALRKKPRIDLQRREIAIIAGVTPALVSYYFPNKWDLIVAAARPVIDSYIDEVREVLSRVASPRQKLFHIVNIFMKFNYNDGYLMDYFLENIDKTSRQEDLRALQEIHDEMLTFFKCLISDGMVRGGSADFMQLSLWGLCKHFAQQPNLTSLASSPEKDAVLRSMAEEVCDFFLNGVATPRFASDMGPCLSLALT